MSSPSPLQDKQIIVTRGVEQSTSMIQAIECLGGTAHAVPLLAFSESTLEDEFLLMIEKITQFEWIFFTSHNSIHFFSRKLKKLGISLKDLHVNIAAVGEKTAKHLRELGVEVDFLPSRFTAEDMIQEFLLENPLAQHILIPKGNLASSILSNGLAKERISHQEWMVYKNEVPTSAPTCLEETVKKHRIDCVTFTSSSAVKNYIKIVNERNLTEYVRACKYAVIGAKTKQTAHNMGLEVHICPDTYTIEAMVEEIKTYFTKKENGR